MDAAEENRWDREARLCLRDGGAFRVERRDGVRTLRRADVPAELLLAALRRHHDRILDPTREGILKAERHVLVSWAPAPDAAGPPLCVKEFRRPRRRERLSDALSGSRARRAWLGAHACAARGLATPRPVGVVEGPGRSWYLSEFLADAAPVSDWVADHRPARSADERRRWRALLDATADFVARLHAHRLRHLDLSARNLLAREGEAGFELALIDLSDLRLGRRPSRDFKVRNLGQLAQVPVPASRSDGLRFLRRYQRRHPEVDGRAALDRIHAIAEARQANWLEVGGREWLAERQALRGEP